MLEPHHRQQETFSFNSLCPSTFLLYPYAESLWTQRERWIPPAVGYLTEQTSTPTFCWSPLPQRSCWPSAEPASASYVTPLPFLCNLLFNQIYLLSCTQMNGCLVNPEMLCRGFCGVFFFAMNVWLVVNQQGKKKRITNATMMLTSFLIHLLLLSSILCCSCLAAKLCPIFYDPMDYSPPGSPGTSWSSVHGISQARILNSAISFSRETSWPRDRTHVSCTARQTLLPLSRQGGMSIWVMSSLEQWKL